MAIKSLTRVANSKVITIATYVRTGYGIFDGYRILKFCKLQNSIVIRFLKLFVFQSEILSNKYRLKEVY